MPVDNFNGNGGDGVKSRSLVRFNADINLGHILQIIALTGAVLAAYGGIQKDLETQRTEYRVAITGFDTRLTVAEHAISERRSEEREFASEMRSSLSDIQRMLTDIRLQAAAVSQQRGTVK